jgi:WD40 repeat protein
MPPNEHWWIVLADFGISKRADEGTAPTTVIKGTDGYKAPELLGFPNLPRPKEIAGFQAADMWALGEISFQMLTGEATFASQWDLIEYYREERKFPSDRLPSSAKGDCVEFISSLMRKHPNNRITTVQGLQHPWMVSRRMSLEDSIGTLSLEHGSSSRFAPLAVAPNHSASWTNLSSDDSGSSKTKAQWKPESLSKPRHSGSQESHPEQSYHSPQSRQNLSTSKDSPSMRGAGVKMLEDHRGFVMNVAFTPSGRLLVSVSLDGAIKGWDAKSGRLLKTFNANCGNFPVLTLSPDGRKMASASGDTIMLWFWHTWSEWLRKRLEGHLKRVLTMAFSPDGKSLASTSLDLYIILWDTESGGVRKRIDCQTWGAIAAFSPDCKTLATTNGSTVMLWDNQSGILLVTLKPATDLYPVSRIALSPDGTKIAASHCSNSIVLREIQSRAALSTIIRIASAIDIDCIAFSPDSKTLASVSEDDIILVWDTQSGALKKSLDCPLSSSKSRILQRILKFSPDGTILAASFNEVLRLWDIRSWTVLNLPEGHSGIINDIVFSLDSKALATASEDKHVGLWRLERTLLPVPPGLPAAGVRPIQLS